MNYTHDTDQIVFLKDTDIAVDISGNNAAGSQIATNGVPAFDLFTATTNDISTALSTDYVKKIDTAKTDAVRIAVNDFAVPYVNGISAELSTDISTIANAIEISCNNICIELSNLIARDTEDVSYRGEVVLSTRYIDQEGHAYVDDNTLYGLLLTNRPNRDRPLHKGFLFRAVTEDVLSDFTVTDTIKTAILHNNDFLLVKSEVNAISDITVDDIIVIKDYDLSVKLLQDLIASNDVDIGFLSNSVDVLSSNLSTTVCIKELLPTATEAERDINNIAATFKDSWNVGDIIIVKNPITNTMSHKQYTAYVYGNDLSWNAMDGNYSADNVIMPADMTITEKFGKYDIPTTGFTVIPCKGQSISLLINEAFSLILHTSVTLPTVAGNSKTTKAEIGTTYKVEYGRITLTDGRYNEYNDPTAAGVSVEIANATIAGRGSIASLTATNAAPLTGGGNVSTGSGTADIVYLSTATTYTYDWSLTYTDGNIPLNNLGNPDPDYLIKSNTLNGTITKTYTGQFPAYYAFTSSFKNHPTALTANGGNVTLDGVTYTRSTLADTYNENSKTFTPTGQWQLLFYLLPVAKTTKTSWTGKDANNVNLPVLPCETVMLTFKDGQKAQYRLFIVENSGMYAKINCVMTLS